MSRHPSSAYCAASRAEAYPTTPRAAPAGRRQPRRRSAPPGPPVDDQAARCPGPFSWFSSIGTTGAVWSGEVGCGRSVGTSDGESAGPTPDEATDVSTETTVAMPAVDSATFQSAGQQADTTGGQDGGEGLSEGLDSALGGEGPELAREHGGLLGGGGSGPRCGPPSSTREPSRRSEIEWRVPARGPEGVNPQAQWVVNPRPCFPVREATPRPLNSRPSRTAPAGTPRWSAHP